jgi:DNA polymerase-3 subunit epsilon
MSRTIDTVRMARQRFPGAQANLDALCRRFGVDNSRRDKHGALLDADLLASVYLELIGGRQPDLVLGAEVAVTTIEVRRIARAPRPHAASEAEIAAHRAFLEKFVKNPLWDQA